jgi:DMSO/TMAO reductase YedYZ molybdopterin-dependent catalytic subunit
MSGHTAVGASEDVTLDELALAGRNHSLPLEALAYDVTPAGLHYLLIHFDVPALDAASWRLEVDGHVDRPLTLDLDALRSLPEVTMPVTLECAGNGRAKLLPRPISQPWLDGAVGTAEWTGTPLAGVLERAGIRDGTVEVVLTGADRGFQGGVEHDYARSLPLDEALLPDVLLVWAMNGEPLPPQHGFPVRAIVPGWYGMTHVKWLTRITLVSEPFDGFQQPGTYQFITGDDDPGRPVTRMRPRALMIPPGIPQFMTRERVLAAGPVTLRGRAWSGRGAITRVEVSPDAGASWADAAVSPPPSPHAWASWSFDWDARDAGEYELCCRATDSTGAVQPLEPEWNTQGMENNAIQRVRVVVRPPTG